VIRTFQTRIVTTEAEDASLQEYATRFSKAKHSLFVFLIKPDLDTSSLNEWKRLFCVVYGLTSRQYNALLSETKGLIDAQRELQKLRVVELEEAVATLSLPPEFRKSRKKRKYLHVETPERKRNRLQRLASKEKDLVALKADIKAGKVRIAFGTKKLFQKQFHREENGYASHEEWKKDWAVARENQFFTLGSGDETGGNQSCSASLAEDGTVSLSIRPLNVVGSTSKKERIVLTGLNFNVGHDTLSVAVTKNDQAAVARREKPAENETPEDVENRKLARHGIALSWRFLKDDKGWKVFCSFDLPDVKIVSVRHAGCIGVDINADHLAVTEVNRHGNPVSRIVIPLVTAGKTADQTKALIGDAVKEIVRLAVLSGKPIGIEKLNFQKKKVSMREEGVRYSRMLSGLAYSAIVQTLKARAFDAGIEIFEVNPAYTSVIGEHLFQWRFGMSRHQGAATAIARRSMKFRERTTPAIRALLSPACKDRKKHAWAQWAQVSRRKAALTALHPSRKSSPPLAKATGVPPAKAGGVVKSGAKAAGQACK